MVLSSIALFKSNCASRIGPQLVFYFASIIAAVFASIIGASGLLVWGVLPLVAIALRISALSFIGILVIGLVTFLTVRTQSSIAREGKEPSFGCHTLFSILWRHLFTLVQSWGVACLLTHLRDFQSHFP